MRKLERRMIAKEWGGVVSLTPLCRPRETVLLRLWWANNIRVVMEPPELAVVCDTKPECSSSSPAHAGLSGSRLSLDMEFVNLSYKVHRGKKTILHGVSGQFRAGELSAIMGSSGAGKSSLMDILIGYRSTGVTGSIRTNGRARDPQSFHKLACYIQQDELIQPHLSVLEAMNVAASLKLPLSMPIERRDARVEEILAMLGLTSCRHTSEKCLSGGQRKRLSIALELVSNPPVLFLDEPTTGLDVVNVTQCISLLRSLAVTQQRTVVCTLHQPSASLLSLFHHVYVLAEGRCVYQGAADQMVPFLAAVNLPCPTYTNPADHVVELTTSRGSRRENVTILSTAIQNGKLSLRSEGDLVSRCRNYDVTGEEQLPQTQFATPASHQFLVLLHRGLLQAARNKGAIRLQFVHHMVSAVLLGGLFLNVGQDAAMAYVNIKFCVSLMVFFMYTHVMTPILLFPAEVKLLKREYFNRWYGLKPYFLAMSVARLPSMLLLGMMVLLTCYFMTNQPLEAYRFTSFAIVSLLIAVVSESLGLLIGSVFSITNGSVVGPMTATPLLMLAVYGVGYGELIETPMKVLMSLSYMRFGASGLAVSMYGLGREPLECAELYCHYRRPELLLRDLGMDGLSVQSQMFGLVTFFILFRVLAFFSLRYRLTPEFDNRILKLVAKLLRHA